MSIPEMFAAFQNGSWGATVCISGWPDDASRNFPGENQLTIKLDHQLKRELSILGRPYTLTLSPQGLSLAPKGRRKGYDLAWVDLVSGDAALAVALNASLARRPQGRAGADETAASDTTQAKERETARRQASARKAFLTGRPAEVPKPSAEPAVRRSDLGRFIQAVNAASATK